ncbi:hypothetical protein M407DRAFT_4810 [Tulasnella calospora MUT 4182]|uniref:Uncharacterized protein n=1 Tax=Tulasnella calospora MUT 4182 TaxID=1051891 RepID=A0A0C3QSI1_9AGAM|nr:hypothetical protein M407DRAFT_4810 [Tulasnella calospora MUT 4182]
MSSSAESNLQGSASEKAVSGRLRSFSNSLFPKFTRSRSQSEPSNIHDTAGTDSKSLEESGSDATPSSCAEGSPSSDADAGQEPVTREARGMPQRTVGEVAKKPRLVSRNGAVRGVGAEDSRNSSLRANAKPYGREVVDKKVNKPTESSQGGTAASFWKALLPTGLVGNNSFAARVE